ncbi:MAG TPA: hypothetical protein VNA69_20260 [Thermoanaerobaculia bacterium]|nr:hypothetical protein [Thermoanaerobaculia bacterium]
MSESPGFIAAFIVIAVAAALWVGQKKRRSRSLELVARDLGFEFSKESTAVITAQLPQLSLFRDVDILACHNSMRRRLSDGELLVFDCTYSTGRRGDRESDTLFKQTVGAFRVHDRVLPSFELSPKTLFHRIASLGGIATLKFENHPEFDKRFLLHSDSEAETRHLFFPMLEFFVRWENRWDQVIEGKGSWIIIYRRDHRLKPREIAAFAKTVNDIGSGFAAARQRV